MRVVILWLRWRGVTASAEQRRQSGEGRKDAWEAVAHRLIA